jgi:hypothetical protein
MRIPPVGTGKPPAVPMLVYLHSHERRGSRDSFQSLSVPRANVFQEVEQRDVAVELLEPELVLPV